MTSHPSLNPSITAYAQGKDTASSMGPHWQQPGWSILDNHMRMRCERRWSWKVREISEGVLYCLVFSLNINLFVRILIYVVWKGDHYPNLPQPLPIIMRKSSRGTIFINIFRRGAHCMRSGSDILGQRI